MKKSVPFLLPVLLLLPLLGQASVDLNLRTTVTPSDQPLTTEKIWKYEPSELNPHLRRWAIDRSVELRDLTAYPSGKVFRVHAGAIEAKATLYFRPDGPWYRPTAEFPCTREPDPRYATAAGAHEAAEFAAKAWGVLVSHEKEKLELRLREVGGEFRETALKTAQDVFDDWKNRLDRGYEQVLLPAAREQEWKSYHSLAAFDGTCAGNKRSSREPLPPIETLMEPPSAAPSAPTAMLARAPAKRWGGPASIRLAIIVGGKELNGQFLIDTGADRSIISPEFLNGQGVLPAWVEVPVAGPEKIRWSGGSGMGRRVKIEQVRIGGYNTNFHDFVLHETDFYSPPETVDACCDGVLGNDFLSRFAVEIFPSGDPEVKLWSRDGFSLGLAAPWVESSFTSEGHLVSDCAIRPHDNPRAEGYLAISGVRWDTGSEAALLIHQPWKAQVHSHGLQWDLRCGTRPMAAKIPVTFPDLSARDGEAEPRNQTKYPAVDVGMAVLGRGGFTLDIPHGRMWFSTAALDAPMRTNHTGLQLEFLYIKAKRTLRVLDLHRNAISQTLLDAGLRKGSVITAIDGFPSDALDQWGTDRRLAGDFGSTVRIEWKNGKKTASSTIKVR